VLARFGVFCWVCPIGSLFPSCACGFVLTFALPARVRPGWPVWVGGACCVFVCSPRKVVRLRSGALCGVCTQALGCVRRLGAAPFSISPSSLFFPSRFRSSCGCRLSRYWPSLYSVPRPLCFSLPYRRSVCLYRLFVFRRFCSLVLPCVWVRCYALPICGRPALVLRRPWLLLAPLGDRCPPCGPLPQPFNGLPAAFLPAAGLPPSGHSASFVLEGWSSALFCPWCCSSVSGSVFFLVGLPVLGLPPSLFAACSPPPLLLPSAAPHLRARPVRSVRPPCGPSGSIIPVLSANTLCLCSPCPSLPVKSAGSVFRVPSVRGVRLTAYYA